MAEKKVTIMVIKVDLNCEKCHKKIKKVLCKIPQIQNQVYDEKANTVTITVVCCSPEKIKKMICCKGGDSVKGIEIKVPEKPKPKEKSKPDKSVLVIVEPTKPKDTEPPPKKPEPAPERVYCMECYEGQGGGPCYHGFGRPPPCYEGYGTPAPPPWYEAYGRPVYDSWGGGGYYGYYDKMIILAIATVFLFLFFFFFV